MSDQRMTPDAMDKSYRGIAVQIMTLDYIDKSYRVMSVQIKTLDVITRTDMTLYNLSMYCRVIIGVYMPL